MKALLSLFYILSLVVPSYAQEGDSSRYEPTPLLYDTYDNLQDMGIYEVLDTLVKPAGYIVSINYSDYYIVLKEKNKWIALALNTSASLNTDSTRRVDLNGQGSKELLLMFTHRDGRYNMHGGFSEEINDVYLYDLDKKTLLLYFNSHSHYESVGTTYYDSTGAVVDPYGSYYYELYQDASEKEMDSLNNVLYTYVETLDSEGQEEYYSGDCSYVLAKNKVTLDCIGEEKAFEEEEPEYYETRTVYLWVKDQWLISTIVK